jgi:alanine racemase
LADNKRKEDPVAERFTLTQIETMGQIVNQLAAQKILPSYVHLANSGGIEQYPESYLPSWVTHVRAASLLHGLPVYPSSAFKRISRWSASLARVEKLERDVGVGYGHTYLGKKGQYIGTLTVGYADGYLNAVDGNSNVVRIDGILVPVVGRVAMDMCMVDLTPYVKEKGTVPEPYSKCDIELMSDGPESDDLSLEKLEQRWRQGWPTILAGIRTRNLRLYDE